MLILADLGHDPKHWPSEAATAADKAFLVSPGNHRWRSLWKTHDISENLPHTQWEAFQASQVKEQATRLRDALGGLGRSCPRVWLGLVTRHDTLQAGCPRHLPAAQETLDLAKIRMLRIDID